MSRGPAPPPSLSIVVPVFNEREALPELYRRVSAVMAQLGATYELILVNDGSSDGSWAVIQSLALADARVKALGLTRNFGHQPAITAGAFFDDNVFASNSGRRSDWAYFLRPELGWRWRGPQHLFEGLAHLEVDDVAPGGLERAGAGGGLECGLGPDALHAARKLHRRGLLCGAPVYRCVGPVAPFRNMRGGRALPNRRGLGEPRRQEAERGSRLRGVAEAEFFR